MSNKKPKGAGAAAYHQRYKANGTMQANRKRKLLRQLKRQPNNKNLERALLDIGYRRKTPVTPFWSSSMIATAKLYKEFSGRVNIDMFSVDPKKQAIALQERGPKSEQLKPTEHSKVSMFSIQARLAAGREGLTWSI